MGDAPHITWAEGEISYDLSMNREPMSSAAYEIRTAGEVSQDTLEDFEGVTVSTDPLGTTIHAMLADEAELHGLLDALSRAGVVLVDVRRERFSDPRSPVEKKPPADPSTGD